MTLGPITINTFFNFSSDLFGLSLMACDEYANHAYLKHKEKMISKLFFHAAKH